MKLIGFNHFQLDSLDVERTRKFYEALGGEVTQIMEREGSWKGYHIRLTPTTTIEVQPPRLPELCGGWDGWDHVALEVDNCAQVCAAIEEAGGKVEKYPSPNMLGDRPILNAVVYGVDGEKIELIQLDPETDEKSVRINGTSHVQVNCSDVERTRDFYLKAFDGKVLNAISTKDGTAIKGYMVEIASGSVLEIQPPRFPLTGKTSAWNTIAIETDDINAAIAKIVSAGGIHEVGPFKGTMGTIAIYNAVMIGPENEHIELIELI